MGEQEKGEGSANTLKVRDAAGLLLQVGTEPHYTESDTDDGTTDKQQQQRSPAPGCVHVHAQMNMCGRVIYKCVYVRVCMYVCVCILQLSE